MEQGEFQNIARNVRERAVKTALACSLCLDEAEDVAQDVMLKLWAMLDRIDNAASVGSLAACMAHNLAIDSHRRRRTVTIEGRPQMVDEKHATPDRELELDENLRLLAAEMGKLPPKEYQILKLRQDEQKTNEEIAQLLGMEKSSVATLLSRARKRLFDEIKKKINS